MYLEKSQEKSCKSAIFRIMFPDASFRVKLNAQSECVKNYEQYPPVSCILISN